MRKAFHLSRRRTISAIERGLSNVIATQTILASLQLHPADHDATLAPRHRAPHTPPYAAIGIHPTIELLPPAALVRRCDAGTEISGAGLVVGIVLAAAVQVYLLPLGGANPQEPLDLAVPVEPVVGERVLLVRELRVGVVLAPGTDTIHGEEVQRGRAVGEECCAAGKLKDRGAGVREVVVAPLLHHVAFSALGERIRTTGIGACTR